LSPFIREQLMFVKDKRLLDHLDSVTGSLGNVSKLVRELDRKVEENFADDPDTPPIDRSLLSILGALERAHTALIALFQQADGVYCPKRPFGK
jgi:hypothetical protein